MAELADTRNVVNLSVDGTFRRTGLVSTRAEDIDAVFEDLRRQNASHLALYFHGGLVPEASGLKTANALRQILIDQGRVYPLFFLWETGLLEILSRNLNRISEQPFFKRLLQIVLKFTRSKLEEAVFGRELEAVQPIASGEMEGMVTREIAGEAILSPAERDAIPPVTREDEAELTAFLEADPQFQQAVADIHRAMEFHPELQGADLLESQALPENVALFSEDILSGIRADVNRSHLEGAELGVVSTSFLVRTAAGLLRSVVGRFIEGSDHGLICTVTEELLRQFYLDSAGALVWGAMKEQAQAAFKENTGLSGEFAHGGTYFLEKLRDYTADPANPPLEVSLIGHSAGSIFICYLLEKAFQTLPQDFKFKNVVFLAPAADFDLFKSVVVDHSERIGSFRMFTMLDEFEAKDGIVPLVYPRSLLYFVSGVLEGSSEKPLVGMHRFYSGKPPYESLAFQTVRDFVLMADSNRIVWSVASQMADGMNSTAISHGDFDENPETRNSLCFLLGG
jgi:hypothetical protein